MTKDWQDESAYKHFDSLDLSGLAWECLRRNSDYRANYPQMRDGLKSPAAWGLRFPGCPGHRRTRCTRILEAINRPGGGRVCCTGPRRRHHRAAH